EVTATRTLIFQETRTTSRRKTKTPLPARNRPAAREQLTAREPSVREQPALRPLSAARIQKTAKAQTRPGRHRPVPQSPHRRPRAPRRGTLPHVGVADC